MWVLMIRIAIKTFVQVFCEDISSFLELCSIMIDLPTVYIQLELEIDMGFLLD